MEEQILHLYLSVWYLSKKQQKRLLVKEYIDTWLMGYNKSDLLILDGFVNRKDGNSFLKIEKKIT